MIDYAKIGARIAYARKAAGMTQEELSEATELAPNTISRYESGDDGMKLGILDVIANATGVTEKYLMGHEELSMGWVDFLGNSERKLVLESSKIPTKIATPEQQLIRRIPEIVQKTVNATRVEIEKSA